MKNPEPGEVGALRVGPEKQHHIDRGVGRLAYGPAISVRDQVGAALHEAQALERRGAVAARAAALLDRYPGLADLLDALIELRVLRF